jgi:Uma2 family endonuclease
MKAALYAAAGIPEYWIDNLVEDQVEVFREPLTLASGAYGYRTRTVYQPGQTLAPEAFPECQVSVQQIIPAVSPGQTG